MKRIENGRIWIIGDRYIGSLFRVDELSEPIPMIRL